MAMLLVQGLLMRQLWIEMARGTVVSCKAMDCLWLASSLKVLSDPTTTLYFASATLKTQAKQGLP